MPAVRVAVFWRPRRNVELQERFLRAALRDDSLEEARYIAEALREGGFEARIVKWEPGRPDLVYKEIARFRPHLVFNVSSDEELCFCESTGIAYAGSGLNLVPLDKATRKKIWLHHGVPTPGFFTVDTSKTLHRLAELLRDSGLRFPLFVKPASGRGSSGITESSIVRDEESLREACLRILRTLNQPALVEEYIAGREISVGLIGNGNDLTVLPLLEVRYRGSPTNTYRHKMEDMEILECPANLEGNLKKHIEETARKAFSVLGARDYARIDLMADPGTGRIYLLELNTFPGLALPETPDQNPGTGVHVSYMGKMAQALGKTGSWLVCSIADAALRRYKIRITSFHVA